MLRILIGETDKWHGKPLYEAIVLKARELHLAGATVLRGPMGFGANSRLHTVKILRLSEDLPMIVEIVDSEEKINTLLPHIDQMVTEGLVTLEKVRVITLRMRRGDAIRHVLSLNPIRRRAFVMKANRRSWWTLKVGRSERPRGGSQRRLRHLVSLGSLCNWRPRTKAQYCGSYGSPSGCS